MNWTILALISIASISVANIYQRVAMRQEKSNPYAGAILFQLILGIITGLFAMSRGIVTPPIELLWHFTISSGLYALGTLFYFNALKLIGASESTILASIGGLATITSAYIFLGERLSGEQLIGFLCILSAVGLVSFRRTELKFNKGLLFSILGTVCYGFAVTNDAFIIKSYDAVSYSSLMSFIPGILLLLIRPSSVTDIISTIKNTRIMRPLFIYCLFYGVQAVTYYLALESGAAASQMSAFFKAEIILTVLLATVFLGERDYLSRKLLATMTVMIGTYLLI